MKSQSVTIQTKATDQYFPVLLFVMLYKEVLTFEAANEILKGDHSNEQFYPPPPPTRLGYLFQTHLRGGLIDLEKTTVSVLHKEL